ncbi:MAG: hypothetical protein AAF847_00180 [Bacteroidota bacterium]
MKTNNDNRQEQKQTLDKSVQLLTELKGILENVSAHYTLQDGLLERVELQSKDLKALAQKI